MHIYIYKSIVCTNTHLLYLGSALSGITFFHFAKSVFSTMTAYYFYHRNIHIHIYKGKYLYELL